MAFIAMGAVEFGDDLRDWIRQDRRDPVTGVLRTGERRIAGGIWRPHIAWTWPEATGENDGQGLALLSLTAWPVSVPPGRPAHDAVLDALCEMLGEGWPDGAPDPEEVSGVVGNWVWPDGEDGELRHALDPGIALDPSMPGCGVSLALLRQAGLRTGPLEGWDYHDLQAEPGEGLTLTMVAEPGATPAMDVEAALLCTAGLARFERRFGLNLMSGDPAPIRLQGYASDPESGVPPDIEAALWVVSNECMEEPPE